MRRKSLWIINMLAWTFALTGVWQSPRLLWADIYRFVDENGVVHFSNTPDSSKFRFFMSEGSCRAAPTDKHRFKPFENMIVNAAKRHNLETCLVKAVIKVESDINPHAVSKKGAMGLMQLMPDTAKHLGVRNCFDPLENIDGGARLLRTLFDKFEGKTKLALAAYNAGSESVNKYNDVPPYPETVRFVEKVLHFQSMYRSSGSR